MLVAAHSPSVALRAQPQNQRRQFHVEACQIPAPVDFVQNPSLAHPPMAFQFSLPVSVPVPALVQVPMPVELPVPDQSPPPTRQTVEVPVYDRLLAAQLAHLASQHHMSEYNRLKAERQKGTSVVSSSSDGSDANTIAGPLIAYVPLSLQAPAYVRDLRVRQVNNSERRAWWISERNSCDSPEKVPCLVARPRSENQSMIPPAMVTNPSLDISQEISAAISSQMTTTHITKTSQTHPINISMVLPAEALPFVASRLVPPSTASPILFRLPENCYLDRLTTPTSRGALPNNSFCHPGYLVQSSAAREPVPVTWSEHGTNDLQSALNGEPTLPPRPPYVPSQEKHSVLHPHEFPHPSALPAVTPNPPSPPRGVVRRRQRLSRATSAPPVFRTFKSVQRRASNLRDSRQCLLRNKSSPEVPTRRLDSVPYVVPAAPLTSQSSTMKPYAEDESLNHATTSELSLPPPSVTYPFVTSLPASDQKGAEDSAQVRQLGNLYLSSCPGKKVRLSGPVKGRGAICRDLHADLSRMKELGARCVICCLDDEELDYLGASWIEYSSMANELGLDVLRIPMPEGLTPLSPASLDSHLKRIIETYSLRGIPVLAHCRGGVGRAGLVACCWMLKLGLFGWKDPQVCARCCSKHAQCHKPYMNSSDSETMSGKIPFYSQAELLRSPGMQFQNQPPNAPVQPLANVPRVCRGTLHLLERVLTVIRRRRGLKAVETYEQVRFLVEFVEYLDAEARWGAQPSIG